MAVNEVLALNSERKRKTSPDVREALLQSLSGLAVKAKLVAQQPGIISGASRLKQVAEEIGLKATFLADEGQAVKTNGDIARFEGEPLKIVKGEEVVIGAISKFSGVATAAARAVELAQGKMDIVCGAWKKMPLELKNDLRSAILSGGAKIRITEEPFVYLDKNYVRIFRSVKRAVEEALVLGKKVCVQIRGETEPVAVEALQAAIAGASIIMVDTGAKEDIDAVSKQLGARGLREGLELAFAGEVTLEDIPDLLSLDIDIIDIGYAVIDAPGLRMRYEVYG